MLLPPFLCSSFSSLVAHFNHCSAVLRSPSPLAACHRHSTSKERGQELLQDSIFVEQKNWGGLPLRGEGERKKRTRNVCMCLLNPLACPAVLYYPLLHLSNICIVCSTMQWCEMCDFCAPHDYVPHMNIIRVADSIMRGGESVRGAK